MESKTKRIGLVELEDLSRKVFRLMTIIPSIDPRGSRIKVAFSKETEENC